MNEDRSQGVVIMPAGPPVWRQVWTPDYPVACSCFDARTGLCRKVTHDAVGRELTEPPCVGRIGLIGCFEAKT